MKNAYAIMSVSCQLGKVCESIQSLASGIQEAEQHDGDVQSVFEGLLLDEMEHAQVLTLELTKLMDIGDDEAHTDDSGSVFAAGALNAEKTGAELEENPDTEEK